MLVEKAPKELAPSIEPVLLPALLRALADPSDDVVLLDLKVRWLGGWVRMGSAMSLVLFALTLTRVVCVRTRHQQPFCL